MASSPETSHTGVPHPSQSPLEHMQGIVERVTYHAEDTGYTVARLKVPNDRDLITIIGRFPDIHAGQTLRLSGYWRENPKYGQQFQVVHAQETKPATLTGLEKYLGSGLIKGIGPMTAKRIVAHFGLETLDIIEAHSERLIEVPGIAQKRVEMIKSAWAAQKAIKEVMVFLQGHGVSTTYAVKIFKQYGDQAIEVVSKNLTNLPPTSMASASLLPTPLHATWESPQIHHSASKLGLPTCWVEQPRMGTVSCLRGNSSSES